MQTPNGSTSCSPFYIWTSNHPVLLLLHLFPGASSGVQSLEHLCLQVTDLLPGLRRMQSVLPEHGCLLVSPGNYWQNQRELFDSDPDLLKTIQKHEPKGLHTSATLRGRSRGRERKGEEDGEVVEEDEEECEEEEEEVGGLRRREVEEVLEMFDMEQHSN